MWWLLLASCTLPGQVGGRFQDALPVPGDASGAAWILTDDSFYYYYETNTEHGTTCRWCKQRVYRYDPTAREARLVTTLHFPDRTAPNIGALVLGQDTLWVLNEGSFEYAGLTGLDPVTGAVKVDITAFAAAHGLAGVASVGFDPPSRINGETSDGQRYEVDLSTGDQAIGRLPRSQEQPESALCIAADPDASKRGNLIRATGGGCGTARKAESLSTVVLPSVLLEAELLWQDGHFALVQHVNAIAPDAVTLVSLINADAGAFVWGATPEAALGRDLQATVTDTYVFLEGRRAGVLVLDRASGEEHWRVLPDG
ncbi:MAG: hypothetical protein H6739_41880 [Alphaproteobacteria bacterium]|nr:hypothetical protein [Alphaproteobacteria bacterium]